MEARQKAAEKMKKLSRTKTDSVESNSMEDGGEGKQLTLVNDRNLYILWFRSNTDTETPLSPTGYKKRTGQFLIALHVYSICR